MKRAMWSLALVAFAIVGIATTAMAAYPDKPIQLIVPYSAGGSTDVLARAIGQVAPRFFPQPVVIVNKAGGGGIPGRVDVAKSRPDGYTLLFGWGSGEDLVVPHQRALPYDIFKDFETVCRMSVHSIVLAVPASAPHKTLADLVKWAKANEPVTATVSTKGGSVDITLLLFAKAAGFKLTTVPGSGGADAITKLVGGHVPFGGQHPSEVLPHFKADRLRGLAVAFDKRDPSVPDVPTFKEEGFPEIEGVGWNAIVVPAKTPKPVVDKLSAAIAKALKSPDVVAKIQGLGNDAVGTTPEEFAAILKKDRDRWAPVIKASGFKAE